jgi:hypothetical protein
MPSEQQGLEKKRAKGERGPDKAVRRKSRVLTAEQFDAVRPFMVKMSHERIEAARLVMVDRIKMQDVADLFGWKARQSVDRAVARVWVKFQELEEARARLNQADKMRGE